ncbi:MAG: endolytic transglycosylase MltG [Deltaproteobacteria bacterium]|nr:endolytic transglycosylase MltG [Deltaproteobacteria bacterium]
MKPFLLTLVFLFLSFLLCAKFLIVFLLLPSQKSGRVEIKVERGEPFSSVVRKLRDQGVIANEKIFSLWARLRGLDKKIHWGIYIFERPLAPEEILNRMLLGKGVFHRVTIPEGLTLREVAEVLANAEIVNKERFLMEANNPEILSRLGLDFEGIEGYLFPDTYYFTPSVTEKDVIVAMTEQFGSVFNLALEMQAKRLGLSVHQVVTLASLIEKETGIEAERPLVSAVFHNRLKQKIPLQSDPTVIYSLKSFSGDLRRRDLQNPSPYNTYRIQGLPPAPICNPGLSSLIAALYPAPVPYMYFVSKNNGSHLFSVSLEEHNRAVKTYQGTERRSSGR